VLLTPDGVVKVIDFGLAKVTDVTVTLEGTARGTIAYMSPEQVRGEHTDQRADIWAAGVVLYEMLAKRRPFAGEHATVVMRSILEAEPKELRTFRPDVPSELAQIVRRALAKDRRERYASAGEMARDLTALQDGAKPSSRSRLAIPAVVALLLIVALGGWYVVRERRPPISGIHASLQRLQRRRLAERAVSKAVTTDRTAQSLRLGFWLYPLFNSADQLRQCVRVGPQLLPLIL
jgi:serine/threonine protein kinase